MCQPGVWGSTAGGAVEATAVNAAIGADRREPSTRERGAANAVGSARSTSDAATTLGLPIRLADNLERLAWVRDQAATRSAVADAAVKRDLVAARRELRHLEDEHLAPLRSEADGRDPDIAATGWWASDLRLTQAAAPVARPRPRSTRRRHQIQRDLLPQSHARAHPDPQHLTGADRARRNRIDRDPRQRIGDKRKRQHDHQQKKAHLHIRYVHASAGSPPSPSKRTSRRQSRRSHRPTGPGGREPGS